MTERILPAGLPRELMDSPNFEEALELALRMLRGGDQVLPMVVKTWAEAEVTPC